MLTDWISKQRRAPTEITPEHADSPPLRTHLPLSFCGPPLPSSRYVDQPGSVCLRHAVMIDAMGWPTDWDDRIAGTACRMCSEGRPVESRTGLRILASDHADAYLARKALVCGYAVLIWRGRHVIEPHHLTLDEALNYHTDVLRVGKAIAEHFQPLKINYTTLGNRSPHLHTHISARYLDDPAPGAPLPEGPNVALPEAQWRADAETLRKRLATDPR